jgi:predicted AAA+ superfamily ATPase
MDKQNLKQVIIDQQEDKLPEDFVTRLLDHKIVSLQKIPQILIIIGLRRSGKSTLLQEIRNKSKENKYYINFDDDRLVQFQLADFQILLELFIELFGLQETFYFDEIQNIPGWERFIRRLHNQGNKIYITGSNATMFSKELGTRLTGRYIQIELYPFSFKEYTNFEQANLLKISKLTTNQKGQLKKLFNTFSLLGGIPEFFLYQQSAYLHSLYESILYKDIIVRYKVNERAIKELVFYLASNVSKEITYNSLRKMLGLASASTVSDYCTYLENSFLCFFINRYDYSLKKQLQYAKKVYFIDQALAKTVGFRISEDSGRLLENIVFLELKRRYQEIYFHKANKECDFLVRQNGRISIVMQVCLQLSNPETKRREIAGLTEALELYDLKTGYIITEDEENTETITYKNKKYTIQIMPIWKWLLQ